MRPATLFLLALLAPLVLGAPAAAQPVQPLDRILPEIRRTHPGEFYDADGPHTGAGGSQHYHLKWRTPEGRIIWYDTDARTGRVLGASPGRDRFDGNPYRRFEEREGRGYDQGRRGDEEPRLGGGERRQNRFRDEGGMGMGDSYSGRWSGGRVEGPRENGRVYGVPGFSGRNYGGSFGGGRYGPRGEPNRGGRGRRGN